MKLDLVGADTPKEGFVTLAKDPSADIVFDLERVVVGERLPLEDDSVEEVYSSLCLTFISDHKQILRELARVCVVGAPVEFRLTHWLHQQAMCAGQKHVISDYQVREWDRMPERFFSGCGKRLKLLHVHYQKENIFDEYRVLFPLINEQQIMQLIPGLCHLVIYKLEVVEYPV